MREFTEGKIQVLVSTTVVEVGVNVPNATFMIIYDAERFGLAQLHQLRGRVGRGEHQSYCVLLADPKTEEGKERMMSMTETNDGFVLSRKRFRTCEDLVIFLEKNKVDYRNLKWLILYMIIEH